MGWHAIEELDKAIEDVKDLLLPFDASVWARFAVVVFFLGGASFLTIPLDAPMDSGHDSGSVGTALEPTGQQITAAFSSSATPVLVLIGASVLGLLLLFLYLSSIFEFVMFRSLDDKNPLIRKNLSRYYKDGLKLLCVRALILSVFASSIFVIIASFSFNPVAGFGILMAMLPLWILFWLLSFVIKNMAVPDIVINDIKFIDSLKKTISLARNQWRQTGVFLLVKIGVGIIVSLISGIAVFLGLMIMIIPLAIIGIAMAAINPILVAIPVLLGLIGLLVLSLIVAVPVKCFVFEWIMRTYSSIEMEID